MLRVAWVLRRGIPASSINSSSTTRAQYDQRQHVQVASARDGNKFFCILCLALEASSNDKHLEQHTHCVRIVRNKSTMGSPNLGGQPLEII